MAPLNYLADFLRRNKLAFLIFFVASVAMGQVLLDKLRVDNLMFDGNTISSTNTNGDIVLNPNGSGGVQFNDLTATTVPYLDANKELVSSSVTPTELGYVSGVTSAIQTQLNAKMDEVSSTDEAIVRFNGTTGSVQNSSVTIDDSANMSGANTIAVGNGTVSAPGFQFLNDTNNGLYYVGTDQIGVSTGGVLGLEVRKSTGAYSNIGMGGASASTSDAYPLLIQRDTAQPLNVQISNPSTDAASSARFQLKSSAGANTAEIGSWANSTVDAYGKRLVVRATDSSTGTAFVADGAAPQDHKFYSGGVTAADEVARFDSSGLDLKATKELRFEDTTGGEYMGFKAPGTVTSSTTFTLPNGDGTSGQALKTDGAGALSWGDASGAGGGGVNYHSDFDCNDISKVVTYDDVSAATDGTGGTPNVTATLETGSPIAGTASYKLTKDAFDRQHEGWAIGSDTLDSFDTDSGQAIWVEFSYVTSANYVASDVEMYVYRVGSNTLEALNTFQGSSFTNGLPAAPNGARYAGWVTPSSTDTSLLIMFHQASANANAVDIYVDRLSIGPGGKVQSAIMSPPIAYTPIFTGLGTVTNIEMYSWREGANLVVSGNFTTGTTTAVEARMSLGFNGSDGGLTTQAFPSIKVAGSVFFSSAAAAVGTILTEPSTTYITFGSQSASGAGLTKQNGSTFGSGAKHTISFKVPITGWTSGNTMSTAELAVRSAKARYTSTAGQSITNATTPVIDFATKVYDTHNAVTTGASWKFTAPFTGYYSVNAGMLWGSAAFTVNSATTMYVYKNTASYVSKQQRVWASLTTAFPQDIPTTIYLTKGDYIDIRADHGESAARSIHTAAGYTYVEIEGQPDLTVIGVNGVNQLVESSSGLVTYPIAASTVGDLTSISLTPGTYDLYAQAVHFSNGATTTNNIYLGFGTASGTGTTGLSEGDTQVVSRKNTASSSRDSLFVHDLGRVITETTTIYLKGQADTSTTNLEVGYKISARRIQ